MPAQPFAEPAQHIFHAAGVGRLMAPSSTPSPCPSAAGCLPLRLQLRGNSVNLADALNLPLANTPKHQSNLQSRLNLTRQIEFDSALFHYDGIPGFLFGGIPFQDVPTHNRIDAGIAFHKRGGLIFSLWAHDLASDRHWENRPVLFTTTGSQTGRSIAFHFSWRPQLER